MTEPHPRRRLAKSGLLRNPLPVIAAAIASFLVVLVLLSARVVTGSDPALQASAPTAALVSHRAHTVLRTTASGRLIAVATQGTPAAAQGATAGKGAAQPAAIVTHTSGAGTVGGARDE